MSWKPNLSSFPHKEGSKTLLWKAFDKIQPAIIEDRLKDDKGMFAINTNKGVLVAKKYIYGYIVSAHMRAVVSAYNQRKRLILYIDDIRKFYSFKPDEILRNSEENIRGKAVMLNWNIKLGEKLEVLT